MHARRLEKLDQISSGEQVELEYPEYLLHGTAQFCFESEIGKEQIDAKRDPDLGQNRVGALLSHRLLHIEICGETAGCTRGGLKSSIKFLLANRLSWSTRSICCMELPNFALNLR